MFFEFLPLDTSDISSSTVDNHAINRVGLLMPQIQRTFTILVNKKEKKKKERYLGHRRLSQQA
jgi:hypothetical protein